MAPAPAPDDEIEIRLLGDFELTRRGVPIELPGDRARAALAALALAAGRVVAADALVETVWSDHLLSRPRNSLQGLVNRIRKTLGPGVIRTEGSGYRLGIPPVQVDVLRFSQLLDAATQARSAGDTASARRLLTRAQELWRGEPLTGVGSETLRRREVSWLTERYLGAVEMRIDLDLAAGHGNGLAPELTALTARHPLRESLWLRLVNVLHRQGRQSEALEAYHALRMRLADDLGVDPSPDLQRAYQAILSSDDATPAHAGHPEHSTSGAIAPPYDRTTEPRQLPPVAADFVGRVDELAALEGAYQQFLASGEAEHRVMLTVIHGPGGVGKTALALRWGHSIAKRFPDGQFYLDLRGYGPGAPTTAAAALGAVLRARGIPDVSVPDTTEERAAMLRTVLAGRRVLMVLDNANSAEQIRPLLPGADSVVVVTSRDQLRGLRSRDGARSLPLRELNETDARRLLAETIGARVNEQPDAATELATLCGRLPLALRIIANLASQHVDQPLAELAADLRSHRLDALADFTDPTADPRAVFSWSYRELSAEDARVFRLLSLAPGVSSGIPAAAVLLGTTPAQARQAMERLASVHLLESLRPGRFRFHDLLRVYAAERAAEHPTQDRRRAMRRLLLWYVAAGYAAQEALRPGLAYYEGPHPPSVDHIPRFANPSQATVWYDTECESLLAAARLAVEMDEHSIAARLAVIPLAAFFLSRPLWHEFLAILDLGLGSARKVGDLQAEAALLAITSTVQSFLGNNEEALPGYERALELYRASGAEAQVGMTLALLASLHGAEGRHEQALPLFERAVAIATERRDPMREAHALTNMAITYTALGRFAESVRASQRAIALRRASRDTRSPAFNFDNLGDAHYATGEYEQAADAYAQALAYARELGDQRAEGIYLANLSRARERLVPRTDASGRAELLEAARRASEALAGVPDTETKRVRHRLHESLPDLDSIPEVSA